MTDDEYSNFEIELYLDAVTKTKSKLIKDMVMMIGEDSYTNFYMADGSVVETCFPLSHYGPMLPSGRFGWYCKWAIINQEYVKDYTTEGTWQAVLPVIKATSTIQRGCRCRFMRDYDKYGTP